MGENKEKEVKRRRRKGKGKEWRKRRRGGAVSINALVFLLPQLLSSNQTYYPTETAKMAPNRITSANKTNMSA